MWRISRSDPLHHAARAGRIVTLSYAALFTLLVTRWRPWSLLDRAGFSSDFYDEQARSFARLQLAVRPEVAGVEGFLIDGSTYLYYGPMLALARVPFAIVDLAVGEVLFGRLTRLSMIIAFIMFCTASFHLVTRRTASPLRSAAFVAATAASPALYLTGWVSVYHETELWAAAFASWAAVGVLRLVDEVNPALHRRHALLTAAAVAAAILTRAPIGVGVALGVALTLLVTSRRPTNRHVDSALVLGVAASAFLVHSLLNAAKFSTLLGLPATKQVLSLEDPDRMAWFAGNGDSFFSLRFLPTTLVQYLRPDAVGFERLVPFVRFGQPAVDRGAYPMETITPASSITASATLLVVGAGIGLVLVLVRRAWPWLALTVGCAVATVPTFAIGFLANRYLVDLLPVLIVPAAYGFAHFTASGRLLRLGARVGVIALLIWGTILNSGLALWTQHLKEPGFTELRYRLDGWIFGGPSPGIIDADARTTVPRNGTVAISAEGSICDAVYVAEDGRWVALERADGRRQLTGSLSLAESPVAIAGGDTWTLEATTTRSQPQEVAVEIVIDDSGWDDGGFTSTSPVEISSASIEGSIAVRVVADDITQEFSVWIDGRPALFSFSVPPGLMLPASGLIAGPRVDSPLCRLLQSRR